LTDCKTATQEIKHRGLLLHLTHYDPKWMLQKATEKRHDQAAALAVIKAMGEHRFNLLLLDIKDAVAYSKLPDLKKRYTVPMAELKELAKAARASGLEFIPKLNFAKSPEHKHSAWLEPGQASADTPEFWKRAFIAVDEVLKATGAKTLHVGMDEDDTRSPDEYLAALLELHAGLKKRGVRMAMWADAGHMWRPGERWRVWPAIEKLPRDVILFPWNYFSGLENWVEKFKGMGFDVIGACAYRTPANQAGADHLTNTRQWAESVRKFGAEGVIVTHWIKCGKANRAVLLESVRKCGPVLDGSDPAPARSAPAAPPKAKPARKKKP
jgi:hypothetical protein